MPPPELYIWHDHKVTSTVSRFYFTEELSHKLFTRQIRPALKQQLRITDDHDVRGYPNYMAAHWTHDNVIPFGNVPYHDACLNVERAAGLVLTRAFGWRASILRYLTNIADARDTALELNLKHGLALDWSMGQHGY